MSPTTLVPLFLIWFQLNRIESSVNLALNKQVTQSSYWGGFPPSRAVNGKDVWECSSGFTHTNYEPYAWLEIDLGAVYEIKRIQIYNRDNTYGDRLDGYFIEIIESLNPNMTHLCYKDTVIGISESYTPSHICRYLGQYVKFSRNITTGQGAVINLCELEVYDKNDNKCLPLPLKGCPIGSYGNGSCDSVCSNGCLNSRCDPDNGKCECKSGWTGDKCESRLCAEGHYSDACLPCSEGCIDRNCSFVNGHCKGCKDKYFGELCNQSCPVNCKNNKCDQYTGYCTIGCKTRIFKGRTCTACDDGLYGTDCGKECPFHCKHGLCDKIDGSCLFGCKHTNLTGEKCDSNVCVNGVYGKDCNTECPVNCKHGLCDATDGTCILGCKHTNMTGDKCDGNQTTTEELVSHTNCFIGSIIAGVVSLINIVFFLIMLLFLKGRRKSSKSSGNEHQITLGSQQSERTQHDINNLEQQQPVDYETFGLRGRENNDTNSAEMYTRLHLNDVHIS